MKLPKLKIGSYRFSLRSLNDGMQIISVMIGSHNGAGRTHRMFIPATEHKAFDSVVDAAILAASDGGGSDLSEKINDFLKNIHET